jgi:hypothetical protein
LLTCFLTSQGNGVLIADTSLTAFLQARESLICMKWKLTDRHHQFHCQQSLQFKNEIMQYTQEGDDNIGIDI